MTRQKLACDDVAAWAGSGAMALSGERDGPPRAEPAPIAAAAAALAEAVADETARWGRRVSVDGPALLGERAAISGLARQGSVSAGGSAFFERAADGWVVLNLPRPCDVAALPALLGADIDPSQWDEVTRRLAAMPAETILERAGLLGLAAAAPPCRHRAVLESTLAAGVGWLQSTGGERRSRTPHPLVVDLTSLWAGPLAGSLLAQAGARVVKVEGSNRPDGARRGPRAFFDLLNAHKRCVELDFESREGRDLLAALLKAADLVLEGSRPRVMDRLGIYPPELTRSGTSWLSISGYGRSGAGAERIAFGDDAAVAGGLWVDGPTPGFVADAVADPLAGLAAAAVAAQILAADRAAVAEVTLAGIARQALSGRRAVEQSSASPPRNQVLRDGAGASGAQRSSAGSGICDVAVACDVAGVRGAGGRSEARDHKRRPEPSPAHKVIRDGTAWSVVISGERVPVAEPRARPANGTAAEQGAHTAELLAEMQSAATREAIGACRP